jgi:DNA-binding MarR family transcriptional regulator
VDRRVDEVRRFHRLVTQRVGALQDEYLERGRSLGASRVLWELAPEGTDIRSLRARLDLDSGYLSRLLRGLEQDGLVRVVPSPGDQRVRVVAPTAEGLAERAELDRLSDALAAAVLAPLAEHQRDELVSAMSAVERLLTAGLVEVAVEDPRSPAAADCLRAYFAELQARFDAGFDPGASLPADPAELTLPAGLLLLARLHGVPVGIGALKLHGSEPAELKRMWVAPDARGLGLGRRLLRELEGQARAHGASTARLETNRNLTEAVAMYRSAGYREVPAFNTEPYAHHWFEKDLSGPSDVAG